MIDDDRKSPRSRKKSAAASVILPWNRLLEGEGKREGETMIIVDHRWSMQPATTVDYRRFNIDRLATQKNQRWKSSSCNDQHTVNDDLRWSKWWFLTDPMINIDLNISTVQLINIASTLIIGKIKDHRMIILESSMINVDIFSKILGICQSSDWHTSWKIILSFKWIGSCCYVDTFHFWYSSISIIDDFDVMKMRIKHRWQS